MKTILYVIDTLCVGGTEKSLLEMASRLSADRFQPVVCRLYSGDDLQEQYESAGIRVIALNVAGKYSFPSAVWDLVRTIRMVQPDLLHTMVFRADQVGRIAGKICHIPVVSSLISKRYDPIRYRNSLSVSRWKHRLVRCLDIATARLTTRFHAVSCAVRSSNCATMRIPFDRVEVIPRGRAVDPPANSDLGGEERSDNSMRPERDGPRLLAVGRLIPEKGYPALLDAMPAVIARYPGAMLQIAGDGKLRATLEQRVRERGVEGHVSFLGYRDDVPRLMRDCDIFVLNSIIEGMPGVLIEAMLAACPIVASDIEENRELIDPGVTGLMAPPESPLLLAEAILRIYSSVDRGRTLGAEARRVARSRYDIRISVRRMEEFYDRVLGISNQRIAD